MDGVDLLLQKNEILCLAGENGAGKTTLMKVLYGLERPRFGYDLNHGNTDAHPFSLGSKSFGNWYGAPALHVGGRVHSRPECGDWARNREGIVLPMIWSQAEKQVAEVIDTHHFSIDPNKPVGKLTVGQKQQVEIVKMLYRNVDILILDEPTAVLTEQEIESLFVTLRALAAHGTSLILITHKLHEIKAISDRVAIMRQGKMVGDYSTASVDEREISRLMMGESVSLSIDKKPYNGEKRPVLRFDDVSVVRRNQERPLLKKVSFTAHSGEILGFAGVGGNGLGVLEAVLGGFLPITEGTITHNGEDISHDDSADLRRNGLAFVPARPIVRR